MKEQNFSSHSRYVPVHHFVTPILMLAVLAGASVNLATITRDQYLPQILFFLIGLTLVPIWWHARVFALKAQDRAIRAEEQLRHLVLTGKGMPSSIRMQQVIALRFAPDEEFPILVEKTLKENLSPKQIKQEIRNWRSDHHRV